MNRQNKHIWVRIDDASGKRVVNDDLGVIPSCGVAGRLSEPGSRSVELSVLERGADEQWNDEYSRALARSGPRLLRTLTYQLDPETGQLGLKK